MKTSQWTLPLSNEFSVSGPLEHFLHHTPLSCSFQHHIQQSSELLHTFKLLHRVLPEQILPSTISGPLDNLIPTLISWFLELKITIHSSHINLPGTLCWATYKIHRVIASSVVYILVLEERSQVNNCINETIWGHQESLLFPISISFQFILSLSPIHILLKTYPSFKTYLNRFSSMTCHSFLTIVSSKFFSSCASQRPVILFDLSTQPLI